MSAGWVVVGPLTPAHTIGQSTLATLTLRSHSAEGRLPAAARPGAEAGLDRGRAGCWSGQAPRLPGWSRRHRWPSVDRPRPATRWPQCCGTTRVRWPPGVRWPGGHQPAGWPCGHRGGAPVILVATAGGHHRHSRTHHVTGAAGGNICPSVWARRLGQKAPAARGTSTSGRSCVLARMRPYGLVNKRAVAAMRVPAAVSVSSGVEIGNRPDGGGHGCLCRAPQRSGAGTDECADAGDGRPVTGRVGGHRVAGAAVPTGSGVATSSRHGGHARGQGRAVTPVTTSRMATAGAGCPPGGQRVATSGAGAPGLANPGPATRGGHPRWPRWPVRTART